MVKGANYWIEQLELAPHPEGGHFRETYRSNEKIPREALPERYEGDRNFSTCVYFLLQDKDHSRLHKLQSDELWHFYHGSPVTLYIITPEGDLETKTLGPRPDKGHGFQAVIKKFSWFGAIVREEGGYSLVGCNVAPGFDFTDFEIGDKEELKKHFPAQKAIIEQLG